MKNNYETKIIKMAIKCITKGQKTFKPETIEKEYFEGYEFDKFEDFNYYAKKLEDKGLIIVHRKQYPYFFERMQDPTAKRIFKIEVISNKLEDLRKELSL